MKIYGHVDFPFCNIFLSPRSNNPTWCHIKSIFATTIKPIEHSDPHLADKERLWIYYG